MNIDGLGFQGLQGNKGIDGRNNKNKPAETSGTEAPAAASGDSAPKESTIDKVQEFYLKFKAGVLSFEELCSRLNGLGVELQYQKDAEGNNVIGVTFQAKDGAVYCSTDGKTGDANPVNNSEKNITTTEENGLTVTTEKHADGSSTITKKDEKGNVVEVEERNADNQIVRLTSYNEAGKIENIKEYEYNPDGSYVETIKNGSGRVVSQTEISADGKTRTDNTPDTIGSILNGQLFSMEDIIETGFNSLDIAKHFTLVSGNDGNFYYEIKTNAGSAQSLEDFYSNVMQDKADEIIAKYESGTITFADIMLELKTVGFTEITGKANVDGSCTIQYKCGNKTSVIEDTTMRDINKDWAKCVIGGDDAENFAKTLKNYNGVSDVEYSKTDYGSEKITFRFNGILQTFTSIPANSELPEKEDEEEK